MLVKILFVLRMIGFGGAERQIVELCQGMDKNKFEISVVLFFHDEGFLEELKAAGVKIHVLATKKTYKRKAIPELIRLMKKEKFDIVQNMLPIANLAGGLAARLSGTRPVVVGSLRNANPFSWRNLFCLMDLAALNFFNDCVITNSETGKKFAVRDYRLPADKIQVIYNGKDFLKYQTSVTAGQIRRELNIPDGHLVVTTIGRITEQKGYEYLIEAANILIKQQNRKVTFLVVGKPEETFAKVKSLIQKYSLDKEVRLLGVRRDIADILAASDVFVLPSLWEGLPNVLLEAMIAGVPVVATDIEPNREVIENNQTGLLVPPKNAPALTEAIMTIVDNPGAAAAFKEAAYQNVLQKFNKDRLVKEYEEFYQSLCRR